MDRGALVDKRPIEVVAVICDDDVGLELAEMREEFAEKAGLIDLVEDLEGSKGR